MSSSKNTIKVTSIISAISFALTYFLSLNIAYSWFDLGWLSNNFLLTISGGIFTSSFVVLLCEIHNYKVQKRSSEDQLYSFTALLYTQIIVLQQTIKNVLINPKNIVVQGCLRMPQQQSLFFLQNLCNVDYTTFCNKNSLYIKFGEFKNESQNIEKTINDCLYFDLAISEETIKKAGNLTVRNVTGKDIEEISLILKQKLEDTKAKCDEFLKAIDYSGRYSWLERKNKLTDEFLDNHKGLDLKEYINKNKI